MSHKFVCKTVYNLRLAARRSASQSRWPSCGSARRQRQGRRSLRLADRGAPRRPCASGTMITVEYQLPLPLSLSEYNRALRYVVARVAESTTGVEPGEGVQILVNEPFAAGDVPGMDSGGTHTVKLLRFRSRMPALLRRVTPNAVSDLHEESWFSDGEASRCKTVYRNPFLGDRFYLCIESNHVAGVCTEENAVGLGDVDLRRRDVLVLDIAGDKPRKVECEDPCTFLSEKTGRGRLQPGWFQGLMGVAVGKGDGDLDSERGGQENLEEELTGEAGHEAGQSAQQSAEEKAVIGCERDHGKGETGSVLDAVDGGGEEGGARDDRNGPQPELCEGEDRRDDTVEFEDACADADDGDDAFEDAVDARPPDDLHPLSYSASSSSSSAASPPTRRPEDCMTCYKVVKMEFTGFGMRRFVQRWTTRAVVPNSLLDIHRKLFCWMDEWCDLTRDQILQLEDETAETTNARLEKHDAAAAAGEACSALEPSPPATTSVSSDPVSVFSYEYVDE